MYTWYAHGRHNLIEKLCAESDSNFEPITENEVSKAILQLNSKQAADESGLTAEHLKNSGATLADEITDIFNIILLDKSVPQQFKTGILSPVMTKIERFNSYPCFGKTIWGNNSTTSIGRLRSVLNAVWFFQGTFSGYVSVDYLGSKSRSENKHQCSTIPSNIK